VSESIKPGRLKKGMISVQPTNLRGLRITRRQRRHGREGNRAKRRGMKPEMLRGNYEQKLEGYEAQLQHEE
jgi:hypothetical protein